RDNERKNNKSCEDHLPSDARRGKAARNGNKPSLDNQTKIGIKKIWLLNCELVSERTVLHQCFELQAV
ncbi:MAG: hypothetical protein ACKO96_41795, partial [Flammeovirgaceae bacterium]